MRDGDIAAPHLWMIVFRVFQPIMSVRNLRAFGQARRAAGEDQTNDVFRIDSFIGERRVRQFCNIAS